MNRSLIMLIVCVAGLLGLSGLLLLLSPTPLEPDATPRLAAEDEASLDRLEVPKRPWQQIERLATGTAAGSAAELAAAVGSDGPPSHFVIATDGTLEVTDRWRQQQPPAAGFGHETSISVTLLADANRVSAEQTATLERLERELRPYLPSP